MSIKNVDLPSGVWIEGEAPFKLGLEDVVKDTTGAFIELNVPVIGTVLEVGEPLISIVGTDGDLQISLPVRVEILDVNEEVIEIQNISGRDWLVQITELSV